MKNKKLFLTIMLIIVLGITISSIALADNEEISDLSLWKGSSETYFNLFNTESGDEFFAEVAKYATGYNAEMVHSYFRKMYQTSFSTVNVINGKTVIFDNKIEADYSYIGNLNTVWGEYQVSWYIFRTKSEEAIKAGYKHLILIPYHSHNGGMKHCHLRYGNQNFDYLTTDPSVNDWWPTFFISAEVDKEKFVKKMISQAKMYATMLPSIEKK